MIFKKHNKFKPYLPLKKQMTTRLIPKEGGTAFIRLPSRNVLILRNCSGV